MSKATRRRGVRRVAVITGTRAEYGLLQSTMGAVRAHSSLELQLVVTGMHLLRRFGRTIDEIIGDGWTVDARVRMQRGDDRSLDQAEGLARGVRGIAAFCEEAGTDIVVVLGDRIEAMAGALAAVTTGRLLAHIHGGDIAPGDFDDSLRHAITKLAHLHLTATPAARTRIVRMGESADRVHVVGAPGLDRLFELAAQAERRSRSTGQALIVHHARGRPTQVERRTMDVLLETVDRAGLHTTIVYPNSDRGHTGIIEAIEAYDRRHGHGHARLVRSLPRDEYINLLMRVDVLIGNSSSGIIEASAAGTPAVNIGPRQRGRQRAGRSVIDAEENATSIRRALREALRKRPRRGGRTAYGDGQAGFRIARHLARVPLGSAFQCKLNAY